MCNKTLHYFVVESFAWLEQSTSVLLCYEFVLSYWFELRVELSYPKSYGGLKNHLHLACIVGDPRWDILRLGKFYVTVVSSQYEGFGCVNSQTRTDKHTQTDTKLWSQHLSIIWIFFKDMTKNSTQYIVSSISYIGFIYLKLIHFNIVQKIAIHFVPTNHYYNFNLMGLSNKKHISKAGN